MASSDEQHLAVDADRPAGGALEEHVELPVPHATCPAFGGQDFSTIFITTTRHKLGPEQLIDFPAAGSVLAVQPAVRGTPANLGHID